MISKPPGTVPVATGMNTSTNTGNPGLISYRSTCNQMSHQPGTICLYKHIKKQYIENYQMKTYLKIIGASLIIICLSQTVGKAQETKQARIGIKGGVNFSNLYTNDADHNKMRIGFNLGLFAKLRISDVIAFQPELYYTAKGAQMNYNNALVNGTAKFHFNYLELPLLAVINVTPYFNVHTGPYFSYLINGRVLNQSSINTFDFEKNINTDDYNKLDAGLAVGAGVDFKAVSIGARYYHGLTTIGKAKDFSGTSYTFPDAKNGVINLYLSVSLN